MPSASKTVSIVAALAGVAFMGAVGLWVGGLSRTPGEVPPPASTAAPEPPKPRSADLQADWSEKENPHRTSFGTWSCNQSQEPLPFVEKWAALPNGGMINGWGPAANRPGELLPFVFQMPPNPNAPDLGTDFETGDILLHSTDMFNGSRNGQGNITWKSPAMVSVTAAGRLWPTKSIGRQNSWELQLIGDEGTRRLASGELPEDGTVTRGHPSAFKVADLSVHAGDVLKLQITRSPSATDPAGDFAGIAFSITEQNPQPIATIATAPSVAPATAPVPLSGNFVKVALMTAIALLALIALALGAIVVLLLKRSAGPRN